MSKIKQEECSFKFEQDNPLKSTMIFEPPENVKLSDLQLRIDLIRKFKLVINYLRRLDAHPLFLNRRNVFSENS